MSASRLSVPQDDLASVQAHHAAPPDKRLSTVNGRSYRSGVSSAAIRTMSYWSGIGELQRHPPDLMRAMSCKLRRIRADEIDSVFRHGFSRNKTCESGGKQKGILGTIGARRWISGAS
jgi:hypothetical protein